MPELVVSIHGENMVRARTQKGAEASDTAQFSNAQHALFDVFEDWLSKGKISRRRELEVLGTSLYTVLFGKQVGTLFEHELDEARKAQQRLRIMLSFEERAGHLANLPWEYLYYPDTETRQGYFLSTHVDLVLSRYMPLGADRLTLEPGENPLRILVVIAKPNNLGPVLERQTLADIQALAKRYPIQVAVQDKPTTDDFLDLLEEVDPHVLHFMGHGRFDKAEGMGELALLRSEDHRAKWVRDREFSEFFVQMGSIPRLIVLHLCEGGASAFDANYAGLAPQLIRTGIQAVVAMQYPISNRAAIAFSQAFYSKVAEGEPVDNAVQHGRWRITIEDPRAYNNRDFGTPVLYMHSRDGVIQPPSVPLEEMNR